MSHFHPQKDHKGQPVRIKNPSRPTPLDAWHDAGATATVTPGSPMPLLIGGLEVQSWLDAPTGLTGWEVLVQGYRFDEPEFESKGMRPASGAVIVEPDGRVWAVSPSNQYGGYHTTFPKGTVAPEEPLSLRANALKEVYEEAGLRVELGGYLCDSMRSLSMTRYYLARRIGGNPADMGWESQAVHLVPAKDLPKVVSHSFDLPVLEVLRAYLTRQL